MPFCTPSSQAGAAQALLTQMPLAQSPGALQAVAGTGSAVSATVEGVSGAVCNAVIAGGPRTGVVDADAAGATAGGIKRLSPPAQAAQSPPQSRAVSGRFARRHRCAAQALLTQTPLAQSPGVLQAKPSAQAAQSPPQPRAVRCRFARRHHRRRGTGVIGADAAGAIAGVIQAASYRQRSSATVEGVLPFCTPSSQAGAARRY